MFEAARHGLIFPQTSHLDLAGLLAGAWGNEEFCVPSIGRSLLSAGTRAHDRCYGALDLVAVGRADKREWLDLRRRGLTMHGQNPVVDLLYCMHNLCLLQEVEIEPEYHQFAKSLELETSQLLAELSSRTQLSRREQEAAFSLQRFCDEVSYQWCTGEPAAGERRVWCGPSEDDYLHIRFAILTDFCIQVEPWPFRWPRLVGEVTGYVATGYLSSPPALEMRRIAFGVRPGILTATDAAH